MALLVALALYRQIRAHVELREAVRDWLASQELLMGRVAEAMQLVRAIEAGPLGAEDESLAESPTARLEGIRDLRTTLARLPPDECLRIVGWSMTGYMPSQLEDRLDLFREAMRGIPSHWYCVLLADPDRGRHMPSADQLVRAWQQEEEWRPHRYVPAETA